MKTNSRSRLIRLSQNALMAALVLAVSPVHAQDQTLGSDTSAIVVNGTLPFNISLGVHDMGSANLTGVQSYAWGQVGDEYIIVAGRTNGMHSFTNNGTVNFDPNFQNTNVWVISPSTQQAWSRSLNDGSSGLNASQVDSLSATNTEFYQSNNTLYVAGGYVYDSVHDNFTTYNTLTALNLSGVADWVKTGSGSLVSNVRQTTDSAVQVTGGEMTQINGLTLLTFGQDFEGPYTAAANGNYTSQVRTFNIVDDGTNLTISNVSASPSIPDPSQFRRRDLNVVPVLTPNGGNLDPGLVALSGVFFNGSGAWTVPAEISATGVPSMANASANGTFKQVMNNYHSAVVSLYDTDTNVTHSLLFGGISLNYYDFGNNTFVFDDGLPFISQATDVLRDANGNYVQYLLGPDAGFPGLTWSNNTTNGTLYFGAGAEFFPASGLPMLDNGLIDLQSLSGNTLLGYIYGGIMSKYNEPTSEGLDTTASGYVFDVYYTPNTIPEPGATAILFGAVTSLLVCLHRRKKNSVTPDSVEG